MWVPFAFMLLGLAFVIAEVFFVSMGLLSVVAGAFILAGAYTGFQHSATLGWVIVALEVVLIPTFVRLAFLVLPRLPFGRRMLLEGPETTPTQGLPDRRPLEGRRGVALTPLRPSGMARFDDERVSVVAVGPLILEGTPIVVVQVEGNEVRVRAVASTSDDPVPDASRSS